MPAPDHPSELVYYGRCGADRATDYQLVVKAILPSYSVKRTVGRAESATRFLLNHFPVILLKNVEGYFHDPLFPDFLSRKLSPTGFGHEGL